jgi:hypothetical protein
MINGRREVDGPKPSAIILEIILCFPYIGDEHSIVLVFTFEAWHVVARAVYSNGGSTILLIAPKLNEVTNRDACTNHIPSWASTDWYI